MFQILEVQEAPAFNGRRSFLTLRGYRMGAAYEAAQTPGMIESFSLCHRLRLLSLCRTSRTISSIWNGFK
jgi:hypothetical protein